jgi:hypothetical protein
MFFFAFESADPFLGTTVTFTRENLKGQCHEIGAKMSPWSSSLGLN